MGERNWDGGSASKKPGERVGGGVLGCSSTIYEYMHMCSTLVSHSEYFIHPCPQTQLHHVGMVTSDW